MLGPLFPENDTDRMVWMPRGGAKEALPIETRFLRGGEMAMGGTMVCVQRGYEPVWFKHKVILDQVCRLLSVCFHPDGEPSTRHGSVDHYAWDFVMLIFDAAFDEVVSFCFVELRDTDISGKQPYLYICDLCTRTDWTGMSFGSQLVHGVQALAWMILNVNTEWKRRLPHGLHLGLTVDPADDTEGHISRMYERCGFSWVQPGGALDFVGYTPYIPYEFMFERADRVPMSMVVHRDVMYQDAGMRIYANDSSRGVEMFCSFPRSALQFVKEYGLVVPSQASKLFGRTKASAPFRKVIADKSTCLGFWFSVERDASDDCSFFVIRASALDGSCPPRLLSSGSMASGLAIRIE